MPPAMPNVTDAPPASSFDDGSPASSVDSSAPGTSGRAGEKVEIPDVPDAPPAFTSKISWTGAPGAASTAPPQRQQSRPVDWRSTVTLSERKEVRRGIREAYLRQATSMEEVIQLAMAVEEEYVFTSSPSRLDYLKTALQFDAKLAERKRRLTEGGDGTAFMDLVLDRPTAAGPTTTPDLPRRPPPLPSGRSSTSYTSSPLLTHSPAPTRHTYAHTRSPAPGVGEGEVGTDAFYVPPPPLLAAQGSQQPYYHGSGIFGETKMGSGGGPVDSSDDEGAPVDVVGEDVGGGVADVHDIAVEEDGASTSVARGVIGWAESGIGAKRPRADEAGIA